MRKLSWHDPLEGAILVPVERTSLEDHMTAAPQFSKDVVPLSDLKVNPGRIVHQVDETHRPVLLTSRGRGVAIVQALSEYEADNEERAFMRSVVAGLIELDAGLDVDIDEVKRRLGLA
jgi:prevent-host-death family protein